METPADRFMEYVGRTYEYQQEKLAKFCSNNRMKFDIDVLEDTILKCYEIINKNGINDDTDKGYDDYLFISFRNNIRREKQYSRNAKKKEIPDLKQVYEDWYNTNNDAPTEKILRDLKEDFSTLYIMKLVEQNFDQEHLYVFRIKYLYKLTYKQLQQRCPQIKNTRQKVIDVVHWLKQRITKGELDAAYNDFIGDFL